MYCFFHINSGFHMTGRKNKIRVVMQLHISESTVKKQHRLKAVLLLNGDKSDKAFVNWHWLWKIAVIGG